MDLFVNAAVVVLPTVYLAAAVGYGALYFAGNAGAGAIGALCLRAGVLLHLVFLALLALRHGQFPAATAAQVLTGIAGSVAVVYLFLEARSQERSTGMWIVGLVFLCQLLASLTWSSAAPAKEALGDPLLGLHVALALLAYAAFTLAAGYGILFLSLYRELKRGSFQTFFNRLPPLEILERLMAGALTAGLLCLSGAIAVGIVQARGIGIAAWLRDPWSVGTLATWGLYTLAVVLRRAHRWQGRQTALASVAGMVWILTGLLAIHALAPRFHGFHAV